MSETIEIKLTEVRRWLEKETLPIVEPLKNEGRSLLDNVKVKLDGVLEACEKLSGDAEKEIEKGGRARRAKVTYKLARNISEMIDRAAIPDEISTVTLQSFREELEGLLDMIEGERGRWFPVISPYFIMDRRRFDTAYRRTGDQLEELRFFINSRYAKAEAVEEAFSLIDKLLLSLGELEEAETRQKRVELRKKGLEKTIEENQKKIALIQSKDEVVELTRIEKEIQELRKEVKLGLRYLQKPFLKFQSLVKSSRLSLPIDEAAKLDGYLSKPFEALATDGKGYSTLKKILQMMEDAFVKGKLRLKSSRLRKAKEQIDDILRKDSLASLHQSCEATFSKRRNLSTSRIIASSQKEKKRLQGDLRGLRRQKKILDSKRVVLNDKIKVKLEETRDLERDLEETVLELTGRNVKVVLQQKLD